MEANTILFDSITDAIRYAFQHDEKSVLSLDRISEVLSQPNLFIRQRGREQTELRAFATRRRIAAALASTDAFVRSGPPHAELWALRPSNPLAASDGTIANAVDTVLVSGGPATVEQISKSCAGGIEEGVFRAFMEAHSDAYEADECGLYWFAGQPHPIRRDFDNMYSALMHAFTVFPDGASVEELHWYLCLCTVGNGKPVKRRSISRELSRRQDLFIRLSRARYTAVRAQEQIPRPASCPHPFCLGQSSLMRFELPHVIETQLHDNFIEAPILDDEDHFDPIDFFSCSHPFQFM